MSAIKRVYVGRAQLDRHSPLSTPMIYSPAMSSRTDPHIKLSATALQSVRRKARRLGQTPSEFVEGLVARDRLLEKSLGDILKPLRRGVERAGLSSEDFEQMVERARKARPAKKRQP